MPSLFDRGIPQPLDSEMGTDIEMEPEESPPIQRTTHSKFRISAFVIPEVHEPPSDDVLGPEGSSPEPAAVNIPAVRSNRAGSTGTPKTAKQRHVRESTSAATFAGEPSGTSPRTTRLRLQYLARLPSRLDHQASDAEE